MLITLVAPWISSVAALHQACSIFNVAKKTWEKIWSAWGKMKLNIQKEEWVGMRVIICLIVHIL